MRQLKIEDCNRDKNGNITRKTFLEQWNNDHIFRARAKYAGIEVVYDNVIFPTGKVAGKDVK